MTQQSVNQEGMTTIPSKELSARKREIRQLRLELDRKSRENSMLLYLMGWNRNRVDSRDACIIILQEKVDQAIAMLENTAETTDILRMLKEKLDFYETHPTFVIGVSEGKEVSQISNAVDL